MPAHDTELELKLRLPAPGDWAGVFRLPALACLTMTAPADEHLESWYFDTADGDLREAGLAYRIRLEGGRWLATVKADDTSAGGLHIRREWTVTVAEPDPSVTAFAGSEAGPLLAAAAGDQPLVPLFSTIFDRRKADIITADGSRVELAADRGAIHAGGREESFAEIELELKEGRPAAVLALGAALAQALPLAVEPRSKYLRALILAGLADGTATAASPSADPDDAAAVGVRRLLTGRIAGVLAAYEAFRVDGDVPETLHQLRVQLRRLRSTLSFAKPLAEPADYDNWRQELGDLGRLMNSLREIDVIRATWQEMTDSLPTPPVPPPWLGLLLATERGRLAKETDAALAARRLTATLLAFWAWVADEGSLAESDATLEAYTYARLTGWLVNMRETGGDIGLEDDAALHRLRIGGKKLRYALESLPGKDRKARDLLVRVKKLQDCLGTIIDARVTAEAMSGWMAQHASRVVHRDAGMLVGWTARQGLEAAGEFAEVWKKFKKAARRWEKD